MTQDTSEQCPVSWEHRPPGVQGDAAPIAAGCPVTSGGYDSPPIPLGPDSLTWRYFGQWTGLFQGTWAGSMQNMHPQLGAAVKDHSIFFMERIPRLLRSIYPIGGVVFDGDRAPQTGAEVRDYHIGIKGVDERGRRYSALNPDVFYWAHATFFKSTLLAAEKFGGGLTEDQKRQLFDEHITWYRMYGMSMRPVPKTWEEFEQYWDHMCRNVLENNWAAREVMDLSTMPKHPSLEWIPDPLWRLNLKVMQRFLTFMTVALYDPPVRELMGYTLTPRQEWLHRRFCDVVTFATKVLPKRWLMHPRKRSAMDRATGRLPNDAPLVETPARNLPPVEYRGQPQFYCPQV
ncbi:oxygenase MpaB family protein [Mycolicibacterium celeriflavum]|uniref:oxygenase MpaB family protein n=1 Tax=Mycolicibacterium celeriflavum TaxID=1249101 RepID=UPI003CF52089